MPGKERKSRVTTDAYPSGETDDAAKREIFDNLVAEALEQIPEEFRNALKNIDIMVEDEPDPELLKEIGYPEDDLLLGLYLGTPLPERTYGEDPLLPDCIYIFRKPLEEISETPEALREEIRITVIHEMAHYFGFDEERLEELGLA